jgi:hypothetical protein
MENSLGGRRTDRLCPCDPSIRLVVTTTSLDDAVRAETRFSQWLNFRVFQQYLRGADLRVSNVGGLSPKQSHP